MSNEKIETVGELIDYLECFGLLKEVIRSKKC